MTFDRPPVTEHAHARTEHAHARDFLDSGQGPRATPHGGRNGNSLTSALTNDAPT